MIAEAAVINNSAPECPQGEAYNNGQCVAIQQIINAVFAPAEPTTVETSIDGFFSISANPVKSTPNKIEPVCPQGETYINGQCVSIEVENINKIFTTPAPKEKLVSEAEQCPLNYYYFLGDCRPIMM